MNVDRNIIASVEKCDQSAVTVKNDYNLFKRFAYYKFTFRIPAGRIGQTAGARRNPLIGFN
jgi:hypothetical protein